MAANSNPQLVHFCNEQLRSLADALALVQQMGTFSNALYNARDLGTIIEAGNAAELIADGSETDGRTRVVGGDVYGMITLINDFNLFMTQGRQDVLAKWRVNS